MLGFTNIVGNLSPLPELVLWRDPVARSGEEAMAVDEALLEWGQEACAEGVPLGGTDRDLRLF